jgi:DUF4097 and DUF4098 domain-containing protein YvlB
MQKSFDVAGPVEVEIRLASGDIRIDPSLDGRVEIDLTGNDEESQRLVEEAEVSLRESHGRPVVYIEVPHKRGFNFNLFGRSGVSCRVRCPERSTVNAKTKSADVEASGTIGGLNVATASGEVEADRVDGGVNVKSASGDVEVREVTGGLNVQTASGDVEVRVVGGGINVNSASGDVTIGEAYDNVNVNTVSGDQEHGAVMRGNVNAPLGDGPFVEIRAKTVSGDIRITRAPAPNEHQEVHA